ncbi:isoamylase early set domain-containing protein [Draconibacterium halophilum]|uniref:Glycoside hydrolase n=1 Tax=Draconibacterium halophilum TaxID=2706887 RepID=A0A6C0R7S7_9BACT|nr:isoamylase early set domain-containing protein [Draconibacterium halophilum]QIA06348.1 glycoside hydrolase [Draconibacterium halophilum]
MSIKKQYLKSKPECKVSFRVAKADVPNADTIKIVGEFNDWNKDVEPMKKLKNGDFTQTLNLETGKEYQFKYLIDNSVWENESEADKLAPNGIVEGEFNSTLVL